MKKFRKKRHQSALTGPIPLPTSAIERSLLLLRAYEGERGVANLLGTVGVFAPTTVALFLIDHHAYLEMGWSQTLLVVGAVGSMATALLMCGIVVHRQPNVGTPPWHFLYFLPEPQGHSSFRPTFVGADDNTAMSGARTRSLIIR